MFLINGKPTLLQYLQNNKDQYLKYFEGYERRKASQRKYWKAKGSKKRKIARIKKS